MGEMNVGDLTVNVRVTVNQEPYSSWRWKAIGLVARILGVRLDVGTDRTPRCTDDQAVERYRQSGAPL